MCLTLFMPHKSLNISFRVHISFVNWLSSLRIKQERHNNFIKRVINITCSFQQHYSHFLQGRLWNPGARAPEARRRSHRSTHNSLELSFRHRTQSSFQVPSNVLFNFFPLDCSMYRLLKLVFLFTHQAASPTSSAPLWSTSATSPPMTSQRGSSSKGCNCR